MVFCKIIVKCFHWVLETVELTMMMMMMATWCGYEAADATTVVAVMVLKDLVVMGSALDSWKR